MGRHDERFKQTVVQAYLSGDGGYETLSRRYAIDASMVRQWVGHFRQHGDAGLRKKFSHYSARFKLSVLQRMRDQELSFNQAAVLFDLRGVPGVVSGWERSYHEGGLEALEPKPRGRPSKMKLPKTPEMARTAKTPNTHEPRCEPAQEPSTLEALRRENEYLRAEVAYLKKLDALVRVQKHAAPKKRKP